MSSRRTLGALVAAAPAAALLLALSPAALGLENEVFGAEPYPSARRGAERRAFAVPMERGRAFRDAVRVYNRSPGAVTLHLYAADASRGPDGVLAVGLGSQRPVGLARWVTLERTTVHLQPHADAVVPFRIDVRSATPPSEMAAIVVESTTRGSGPLDLVQRVAILLRPAPPGYRGGAQPLGDPRRGIAAALAAVVVTGIAAAITARRHQVRRRALRRLRAGRRLGARPPPASKSPPAAPPRRARARPRPGRSAAVRARRRSPSYIPLDSL